ncbi:MAG: M14 family metallopeptidase [Nitrosomonas sp.]|nr:M14 family metallopeptidase [Nitrosomonas sp.]
MQLKLRVLHEVPEALLSAGSDQLYDLLGGPTLIHLDGNSTGDRLFVSTLLHGNEDTGWLAIRALLAKYIASGSRHRLPRGLSIFIGNVAAARLRLRRFDDQPDYNRVWPGSKDVDSAESKLMREVVEVMSQYKLFASVDIHNNTGTNPHYACLTWLDDPFFYLATLFSRTVVYFQQPLGTQTTAFSTRCPAVAFECGKPGSPGSTGHALQFLESCLHLHAFPSHPFPKHDMDLFHTVATVKISDQATFGFGLDNHTLNFSPDLDRLNFHELMPGTVLGSVNGRGIIGLAATNGEGVDVTERYFALRDKQLVTRHPLMPAMLTCDSRVIRQDCLCYLMERMAF